MNDQRQNILIGDEFNSYGIFQINTEWFNET